MVGNLRRLNAEPDPTLNLLCAGYSNELSGKLARDWDEFILKAPALAGAAPQCDPPHEPFATGGLPWLVPALASMR